MKSGDTLGGIAVKHDVSLKSLLNLNPNLSTSSPLKIGTKIKVSGSTVAPTSNVKKDKIGNTFEGRTYEDHVVSGANENKNYLDSVDVPSQGRNAGVDSFHRSEHGCGPGFGTGTCLSGIRIQHALGLSS